MRLGTLADRRERGWYVATRRRVGGSGGDGGEYDGLRLIIDVNLLSEFRIVKRVVEFREIVY